MTTALTTALTGPLTTALTGPLTTGSAGPVPGIIPSPAQGVWYVGPFPIRAYALCIIAGILIAIVISERRWVARGGQPGDISDLALWGVPFGVVGGRAYHVATDWQLYFGADADPVTALYVWRGGLGVTGAIILGLVGVVIGARRKQIKLLPVIDAIAPGVLVAQALGRWGNYFNQELYGRVTDLPWALEIDRDGNGNPVEPTYHHPTFLYECLWSLGMAGLLVWADRRFRLGHGRVAALYMMGYSAGRFWIEQLRVDQVQMDDVYGQRLHVWTSILFFAAGLLWFVWSARRRPGREEHVYTVAQTPATPEGAAGTEGTSTGVGTGALSAAAHDALGSTPETPLERAYREASASTGTEGASPAGADPPGREPTPLERAYQEASTDAGKT